MKQKVVETLEINVFGEPFKNSKNCFYRPPPIGLDTAVVGRHLNRFQKLQNIYIQVGTALYLLNATRHGKAGVLRSRGAIHGGDPKT
jgi:hypothetical protein